MRPGHTLLELLMVLAIVGVLLGIALPGAQRTLDAIHARAAAAELASLLALARHTAVYRGTRAAVRLDSAAAAVAVHVGRDTVARRSLRDTHGVTMHVTRDSVAYGPSGRGHGGANATVVLKRRAAVESVFVSRLGRVRRR
jgi:prepilin-type N-terminal cleavage/methylation domain-containing protein